MIQENSWFGVLPAHWTCDKIGLLFSERRTKVSDKDYAPLSVARIGVVADLWTTRYSEMKSILLPIPPLTEQDQIVRFLDWKVSEINRMIPVSAVTTGNAIAKSKSLLARKIMLLQELKIRLIADTVTGKIDVRNIEIPDYEFVGEESQAEEEIDAEGSENEKE